MSINVNTETLLAFNDARGEIVSGKRYSLATLHRWRLRGNRGIKLETVLIGGVRYTSKEAISRMISAQNAGTPDTPDVNISLSQRNRQYEAAQRELEKMGV